MLWLDGPYLFWSFDERGQRPNDVEPLARGRSGALGRKTWSVVSHCPSWEQKGSTADEGEKPLVRASK